MPGMKATMHEWKAGTLHSGSKTGPVVHSQQQALAIALNEERAVRASHQHAKPAKKKSATKPKGGRS